jgi:anti-anti-sigma factor
MSIFNPGDKLTMEIKELERNGTTITASLEGRMDALSAPDFSRQMDAWIESGLEKLAIECSRLDYISSAGLRAILITAKKLRARSGSLRLAALQENVRTVFTISGFDKIIPIAATLADAVKEQR